MPDMIHLLIDGEPCSVPRGTSIAAAIMISGKPVLRHSVAGEPRGPVCGMGICFECRVTVNGVPHIRSCMTTCEPGIEIRTT